MGERPNPCSKHYVEHAGIRRVTARGVIAGLAPKCRQHKKTLETNVGTILTYAKAQNSPKALYRLGLWAQKPQNMSP